jgi:hypothetical protein
MSQGAGFTLVTPPWPPPRLQLTSPEQFRAILSLYRSGNGEASASGEVASGIQVQGGHRIKAWAPACAQTFERILSLWQLRGVEFAATPLQHV